MSTAPVEHFLRGCLDHLDAAPDAPGRLEGRAALEAALERSRPLEAEPARQPVLDSLDRIPSGALVDRFLDAEPHLRWVSSFRTGDGGTDAALAPLNDVLDLGDTTVGVMYVGPGRRYPLHNHPPQELYLVISGSARWRYGGYEAMRPVEPGHTLYNRPNDLHAVTAGSTPLVALYILWPS